MFGLSPRKSISSGILKECENNLGVYRDGLITLIKSENYSEASYNEARKNYFNAVFDSLWNSLALIAPTVDQRIRLVFWSPEISGLPPEITDQYLLENGISAGCSFAILYYAITNKPVKSTKDFRTMSMLNHAQNKLMEQIINELGQIKGRI